MDYINRLDNYEGPELALKCQHDDIRLYEEALCIYKKFNEPHEAIKVLLYKLDNLPQAHEFAEKTNLKEVWGELGRAQLQKNMLSEAIDSFIKAEDPSSYQMVITSAKNQEIFE